MIRNVIFDFGNVLARFDPASLARKYAENEADAAKLAAVVFDERWADFDGGRLSYEEHLAGSLAQLPERLHEAAARLFAGWTGDLAPIPAIQGLVKELYRRGYGLYILSNAPVEFSSQVRQNYAFTALFDGAVYSAEIQMDKPHAPIYRHLLSTYGLDPDECLFIDDKPVNVEGARAVGMHAVTFNADGEDCLGPIRAHIGADGIIDHAKLAKRLFSDGCNCAQAVFLAFRDRIGMDEAAAMRLSSSFGGGMGRMREVCGAVSGMLMVLGLTHGYDANCATADEDKKRHYERVQQLCGRFREENGSIICRELLDGHIQRTAESGEQTDAMRSTDPTPTPRSAEYYQKRPCGELVESAARLLEQYLAELEGKKG